MTSSTGGCHNCGTAFSEGPIHRGDSCPKCGRDLRVCKNCNHFDPQAYNMCRESQADRVVEKEKANFCDFFTPSLKSSGEKQMSPAEKARLAAEALFKKKS